MAGIKTVASKNMAYRISTTKPTGPTIAAFTAATDVSCDLAASGTRVSATASESINDPSVCEDTNASAFGTGNFEGSIAPFVKLDASTGAYALADNPAFEMFKVKNTIGYLWVREGVKYGATPAAGQLVSCYEVRSDTPQRQQAMNEYIKRNIPLSVTPIFENVPLATP